jgi:hypothetical protein
LIIFGATASDRAGWSKHDAVFAYLKSDPASETEKFPCYSLCGREKRPNAGCVWLDLPYYVAD